MKAAETAKVAPCTPLRRTEHLAPERMRDHDVVGDFDGVHGVPSCSIGAQTVGRDG